MKLHIVSWSDVDGYEHQRIVRAPNIVEAVALFTLDVEAFGVDFNDKDGDDMIQVYLAPDVGGTAEVVDWNDMPHAEYPAAPSANPCPATS